MEASGGSQSHLAGAPAGYTPQVDGRLSIPCRGDGLSLGPRGASGLTPWPGCKLCLLWGQVGACPCAYLLGRLLIKSLQSQQCLTWPVTAPGLMDSVLETLDPEDS